MRLVEGAVFTPILTFPREGGRDFGAHGGRDLMFRAAVGLGPVGILARGDAAVAGSPDGGVFAPRVGGYPAFIYFYA